MVLSALDTPQSDPLRFMPLRSPLLQRRKRGRWGIKCLPPSPQPASVEMGLKAMSCGSQGKNCLNKSAQLAGENNHCDPSKVINL